MLAEYKVTQIRNTLSDVDEVVALAVPRVALQSPLQDQYLRMRVQKGVLAIGDVFYVTTEAP